MLAHLGGSEMVGDVLKYLAGEKVYFDTAYVLSRIKKEDFLSVLDKHGDDRILFASDSPWSSMDGDVEILKSFVEDKDTQDKILYKNALSLLGL